MKRIFLLVALLVITLITTSACTQADRVSTNLSKEADSFNVVRQITVINCIANDILFQMTGKMSIQVDTTGSKLDVIIEDENGNYSKHFIGLSDNVTYIVEQKDYKNVSNYKYTLNYNPKMWVPVDVETID